MSFGHRDVDAMLSGFVSRGPVVGETEVAAFERSCWFYLPPDYRRFLLEQNGGERASVPGAAKNIEVRGEPRGGALSYPQSA